MEKMEEYIYIYIYERSGMCLFIFIVFLLRLKKQGAKESSLSREMIVGGQKIVLQSAFIINKCTIFFFFYQKVSSDVTLECAF